MGLTGDFLSPSPTPPSLPEALPGLWEAFSIWPHSPYALKPSGASRRRFGAFPELWRGFGGVRLRWPWGPEGPQAPPLGASLFCFLFWPVSAHPFWPHVDQAGVHHAPGGPWAPQRRPRRLWRFLCGPEPPHPLAESIPEALLGLLEASRLFHPLFASAPFEAADLLAAAFLAVARHLAQFLASALSPRSFSWPAESFARPSAGPLLFFQPRPLRSRNKPGPRFPREGVPEKARARKALSQY